LTLANATVALARIRRAEPADAATLTSLALTSKRAWGYDAAFTAACRTEITVDAAVPGDPTRRLSDPQVPRFS
jgi:hypothetical protein